MVTVWEITSMDWYDPSEKCSMHVIANHKIVFIYMLLILMWTCFGYIGLNAALSTLELNF